MIKAKLSKLVQNQFPDFYKEDGKNFLAFVEAYYEYLEQNGKLTDSIQNLQDYRSIDTTLEEYIDYFQDTLLPSVPHDVLADKKIMAKYIKYFNEARGSLASYKLLFRTVFNEDAEVHYPAVQMLKVSEGDWSLQRYLSTPYSGNNFNFIGKTIQGLTSGATALVEDVAGRTVRGRDLHQLQLSKISGTFNHKESIKIVGQTVTESTYTPTVEAGITSVEIISQGAEYKKGDVLDLVSDNVGSLGKVVVNSTVDKDGSISFIIDEGGSGYTTDQGGIDQGETQISIDGGDGESPASFTIGESDIGDTFAISMNVNLLGSNNIFGNSAPFVVDGNDYKKASLFADMPISSPDYGFPSQNQVTNEGVRFNTTANTLITVDTTSTVEVGDSLYGFSSSANAIVTEVVSNTANDKIFRVDTFKRFDGEIYNWSQDTQNFDLTSPERFWIFTRIGRQINDAIAPDGTKTATRLIETHDDSKVFTGGLFPENKNAHIRFLGIGTPSELQTRWNTYLGTTGVTYAIGTTFLTPADVAAGSFVAGTTYGIKNLGTGSDAENQSRWNTYLDRTAVNAGLFEEGVRYKITNLGTSTSEANQSRWNAYLGTSGVTYSVGDQFKGTAANGSTIAGAVATGFYVLGDTFIATAVNGSAIVGSTVGLDGIVATSWMDLLHLAGAFVENTNYKIFDLGSGTDAENQARWNTYLGTSGDTYAIDDEFQATANNGSAIIGAKAEFKGQDHFLNLSPQGSDNLPPHDVDNFWIWSLFAKRVDKGSAAKRYLNFRGLGRGSKYPVFDIEEGTVVHNGDNWLANSSKIENVGNGWYRCSSICKPTTAVTGWRIGLGENAIGTTLGGNAPYAYLGDGVSGFHIWGAQIEKYTDDLATTTFHNGTGSATTFPLAHPFVVDDNEIVLSTIQSVTAGNYLFGETYTITNLGSADAATNKSRWNAYLGTSNLTYSVGDTFVGTYADSSLIVGSTADGFVVVPDTGWNSGNTNVVASVAPAAGTDNVRVVERPPISPRRYQRKGSRIAADDATVNAGSFLDGYRYQISNLGTGTSSENQARWNTYFGTSNITYALNRKFYANQNNGAAIIGATALLRHDDVQSGKKEFVYLNNTLENSGTNIGRMTAFSANNVGQIALQLGVLDAHSVVAGDELVSKSTSTDSGDYVFAVVQNVLTTVSDGYDGGGGDVRDLVTVKVSSNTSSNTTNQFDSGPLASFESGWDIRKVGSATTVATVGSSASNTAVENAYSKLQDSLVFKTATFGTIDKLSSRVGGSGFSVAPNVRVVEPNISSLGIGEQYLTLETTDINWGTGDSNITALDTNDSISQASTGASGDVKAGAAKNTVPVTTTVVVAGVTKYRTVIRVWQPFNQREPGNISFAKGAAVNLNFMTGEYIPGEADTRSSTATGTATIIGIVDKGILGSNAKIDAVVGADGAATGFRILDSGFSYTQGETVRVAASDRSGSVSATLKLSLNNVANSEGYYATSRSHVSSKRGVIQDSRYYQEYSYEIISPISLDRYKDVALKLVHPAGQTQFAKYQAHSNVAVDIVTSSPDRKLRFKSPGTAAINFGSRAVVGTGTTFDTHFDSGDFIILKETTSTVGAVQNSGSWNKGVKYKITNLGSADAATNQTNWNNYRGTTGVTYAVGDTFHAVNAGSLVTGAVCQVAVTPGNLYKVLLNSANTETTCQTKAFWLVGSMSGLDVYYISGQISHQE